MGRKKQLQPTNANKTVLAGHLKHWRSICQMSQMDLALQCDTSARHLSFVETGRAIPSRDLLMQICEVLAIPISAQNKILISSGYTPVYEETGLSDLEMIEVKQILHKMLVVNEPAPAIIADRCFNIIMYNRPFFALCEEFVTDKTLLEPGRYNVLRVLLHPDGLSRYLVNFPLVYKAFIRRAHDHLIVENVEDELRGLLDEMNTYRPPDNTKVDKYPLSKLVLPVHLKNDRHEIQLVSTIASLGSPLNMTLQELQIEVGYPINDESEEFFKNVMDKCNASDL